jgi:N6-L-threonylcarbamoyladenine synthase
MPTVLAIETSCDETSVAVVCDRQVISNVVSSQVAVHAAYGGVVPEIACRQHLQLINPAIATAMQDAGLAWSDLDGIGVTAAPGLIGALIIGVSSAKTLALLYDKPLIGVHHLEGHICSAFLSDAGLSPPFLCLLVSGGHTSLIAVSDYGNYAIAGQTRDDAVGEAFDKVARLLGLGYPGGPAIDRVAQGGNAHAFRLPQGKIEQAPYDFSFSGLKTAVLRLVQKFPADAIPQADIAASFQQTVADTLVKRTIKCAKELGWGTIVAVGGVAANSALRSQLIEQAQAHQLKTVFPPLNLCTDNAAMIACAAEMHLIKGEVSALTLNPQARLSLEQYHVLYDGNSAPVG